MPRDRDRDPASGPQVEAGDTPAEILVEELGRLLLERRIDQKLSIRQAAAEAGVSFSTLSRVEAGAQPDLATFLRLSAWLGIPPQMFFSPISRRPSSGVDEAIRHLNMDPRLSKDAAQRIAALVKDMYAVLAREPETPPPLTLHLRATTIMRPGVPERLAGILRDMRRALEQTKDGVR